ncbi:MAG: hypothetical protein LC655_06745, partial [Bacteroidales bacterium]|nr:hypothetical protein [Bacteroidales bacterium]
MLTQRTVPSAPESTSNSRENENSTAALLESDAGLNRSDTIYQTGPSKLCAVTFRLLTGMVTAICLTGLILLTFSGCTTQSQTETADQQRERFVDSLLTEMTLDEKIGQLTLYTSGWTITGPALDSNYRNYITEGRCGN